MANGCYCIETCHSESDRRLKVASQQHHPGKDSEKYSVRQYTSPSISRQWGFFSSFKMPTGALLVAQWLGIRLPMQGTQVWALVQEDPTCCRATKPVRHNYWDCALQPASHSYWARVPQLLKPARLEPTLHKRSHRKEKPAHRNEE